MALRRLTLAIALLTGGAQAQDRAGGPALEGREGPVSPGDEDEAAPDDPRAIDGLLVRPDGTVAGAVARAAPRFVPWSVVRLVLPDLDASGAPDPAEPIWIDLLPRGDHVPGAHDADARGWPLRALAGAAVLGRDGEVLGVVRACRIGPACGRLLALALEVAPWLRGEADHVEIPWSNVRPVPTGGPALVLHSDVDPDWIRLAPAVDRRAPGASA